MRTCLEQKKAPTSLGGAAMPLKLTENNYSIGGKTERQESLGQPDSYIEASRWRPSLLPMVHALP